MQVIRHTSDELELWEPAVKRLLPLWIMSIMGLAMIVGILDTTQLLSAIGLGILGLMGIYTLFSTHRTERCILDKRLGKLILTERWLLGLRVHEYLFHTIETWQIEPLNSSMHKVSCLLTSGKEVVLYIDDMEHAVAFAEQVGMFLWGDSKNMRD